MFRTVPLSIIRSFHCTQQWYMSYSFADRTELQFRPDPALKLASCQQTCMTYSIAVCTVKNS